MYKTIYNEDYTGDITRESLRKYILELFECQDEESFGNLRKMDHSMLRFLLKKKQYQTGTIAFESFYQSWNNIKEHSNCTEFHNINDIHGVTKNSYYSFDFNFDNDIFCNKSLEISAHRLYFNTKTDSIFILESGYHYACGKNKIKLDDMVDLLLKRNLRNDITLKELGSYYLSMKIRPSIEHQRMKKLEMI